MTCYILYMNAGLPPVYGVHLRLQEGDGVRPMRRAPGNQCQMRSGRKEWARDSANYCSRHLVDPDAPVKYMDANGAIVEK